MPNDQNLTATWNPARDRPELTGDLNTDAAALTRYVTARERLIASLPGKPARDDRQRDLADGTFAACREVRRDFVARHANAVYDVLTERRTRFLRISDLAYAAAERFPGLVPTQAQIDAERTHIQAHKDGREIDQAILLSGMLRSATAGAHLIDAMLLPVTATTPKLRDTFRRAGRVDFPSVSLERRGHTAHLTLRNQRCLNAEDNRLVSDMETAVDLALLDDQVRVGVLRGAAMTHPRYLGKRVFCAGINLTDLRNGAISYLDFMLRRELSCVGKLVHGVLVHPDRPGATERTVQKPWIAAIDSFAIGGGMQLALVCDRVIAERDAYFSLPAAQEGIVPGLGNLRLGRLTGARLARRIILGGATIRATEPEASLVCDEAVPADRMDESVERSAAELAAPAVAANRRMLILAEEPLDRLRAYVAEFAVVQATRLYSTDVLDKVERRWARNQARSGG